MLRWSPVEPSPSAPSAILGGIGSRPTGSRGPSDRGAIMNYKDKCSSGTPTRHVCVRMHLHLSTLYYYAQSLVIRGRKAVLCQLCEYLVHVHACNSLYMNRYI